MILERSPRHLRVNGFVVADERTISQMEKNEKGKRANQDCQNAVGELGFNFCVCGAHK
jgi:hypothetical protein